MRFVDVAIVAGPEAGHAFPAFALAERLEAAGIATRVYTGEKWVADVRARGIDVECLPGLAPAAGEHSTDAGLILTERAARMAVLLAPLLKAAEVKLVISDVITVCGEFAAELLGINWIELSPHPLYKPSTGLPPIGSGLAVGRGFRGKLRDATMRFLTGRSIKVGDRQRLAARKSIGLAGKGITPVYRFIATLPALEVSRPDWPTEAKIIGPLLWEPTTNIFDTAEGVEPLIVVAPSTAESGVANVIELAVAALSPENLNFPVRVVISSLTARIDNPPCWLTVGLGRQDEIIERADLVISGGGHGILAKTLLAGKPMVLIPGGGDQWELANRAQRAGFAEYLRPVSVPGLTDCVKKILEGEKYLKAARLGAGTINLITDPVSLCRKALTIQ